jgi:hypothetical protein
MGISEAQIYAQQQWEALTPDQQAAYEQKAQMYGDPIVEQERQDAASTPSADAQLIDQDIKNAQAQQSAAAANAGPIGYPQQSP